MKESLLELGEERKTPPLSPEQMKLLIDNSEPGIEALERQYFKGEMTKDELKEKTTGILREELSKILDSE